MPTQEHHDPACGIQFHAAQIDGKMVAYHDGTHFLVQVGRGKGSYRTKYDIVGKLTQAIMYYTGINLGRGFKKRLLMPSCTHNPVLARRIER